MEMTKTLQSTIIPSTIRKNKVDDLIKLLLNEEEGEEEGEEEEDNSEEQFIYLCQPGCTRYLV